MSLDKSVTTYLCQRCGNCCRWPGDVIVTEAEVEAIAAHEGLDVAQQRDRHIVRKLLQI